MYCLFNAQNHTLGRQYDYCHYTDTETGSKREETRTCLVTRRGRSCAGIQADLSPEPEYFAATTHILSLSIVGVHDFSGFGCQKIPLKPRTRSLLPFPLSPSRLVRKGLSLRYFLGLE